MRPDDIADVVFRGVERIADTKRFSPAGGGDCYVCSAGAIVNHFVEDPPTLAEIYQRWVNVGAENGGFDIATNDFWYGAADLGLEFVVDPPFEPEPDPGYKLPSMYSPQSYARRVRVYLEAGYLVHAQMLFESETDLVKAGAKSLRTSGRIARSDHLVVIDGYRTVTKWKKIGESWGGRVIEELHIVCSSSKNPKPYWIDSIDFVEEHHGFGMWFVRPRRR